MLLLQMERSNTAPSLKTPTYSGQLVAVVQVSLLHKTLMHELTMPSYRGFPGIVLRFYFKTRPAPKVYKRNVYIYPIEHYEKVMRWMVSVSISLYSAYEDTI